MKSKETFASKLRELFGIRRRIRHEIHIKYRELEERQINAALANLDPVNPAWLAVHQLIETARENALENADQNMDPPGILAGYVGGAAHLKMLKDDLNHRRELGLQQRTEEPSRREAWLKSQQVEPPTS